MYIFFLSSSRELKSKSISGKIVLKNIITRLVKFERFSKLQGIAKGMAGVSLLLCGAHFARKTFYQK